jgi:DNA-directed RNA polymerase beta subunit
MMLFSAACTLTLGLGDEQNTRGETGGTFLVRGAPKLVTDISRLADNFLFVESNSKNLAQATIYCRTYERRHFSTTNVTLKLARPNPKTPTFGIGISVVLPFIQKTCPLALILRALGFDLAEFKRQAVRVQFADSIPDLDFKLQALFEVLPSGMTTRDARLQLGLLAHKTKRLPTREKLEHTAKYFLERSFLSHTLALEAKATLLAKAVVKLFTTTSTWSDVQREPCEEEKCIEDFDEKDHLAAKRCDTAGFLWTTLVRQIMTNHLNFISKSADTQMARCNSGSKTKRAKLKHSDQADGRADLAVQTADRQYGGSKKRFGAEEFLESIDIDAMSNRLKSALATGQWSANKASQPASRKNVAQQQQSQNYLAVLSHFSRTTAAVTTESKQQRQMPGSAWDKLCPFETPDGKQCGLVSHLSFGTRVSIGISPWTVFNTLRPFLDEFDFVPVQLQSVTPSERRTPEMFMLCFEGGHVGYVSRPALLTATLRTLRRLNRFSQEVSITLDCDKKEINVLSCGSRILSPLLAIDPDTWPVWQQLPTVGPDLDLDLLERFGLLEYLDAAEARNLVVALSPQDLKERLELTPDLEFTHMEVHESMILGVSSGMISFAESNHAARNSFESSMSKQAMDSYFPSVFHATKHLLEEPQVPLTETRMGQIAGGQARFKGQMVKVAILAMGGDNQEDACDMNEASQQRGMFLGIRYRPEREQLSSNPRFGSGEQFEKPDPRTTLGMQNSPTEHLMDSGLPFLGSLLQTGHIGIGKTKTFQDTKQNSSLTQKQDHLDEPQPQPQQQHDVKKRCASMLHQGGEAVVYQISKNCTFSGDQTAKYVTKQVRPLLEGDKVNAHAQKTTIARFIPVEDCPFSVVDGTPADIYINPGSFKRRTWGFLEEMLASKTLALRPSQARKLGLHDGTAFARQSRLADQDSRGDLLHDPWPQEFDRLLGELKRDYDEHNLDPGSDVPIPFCFARSGKERMMDGKTGKLIDALVFVGLAHMQRLMQFSSDKLYACYTAQKTVMLQYRGGRAEQGGMRVGTMEVDVLAGHGVAFIMYESLVTFADPTGEVYFCGNCGVMCLAVSDSMSSCAVCQKQSVAVKLVSVTSFINFLFFLIAMNVQPQLMLETCPQ